MAIQAQLYPSNASSPLCDNGYCAGGFIESCFNSQQKHRHHQQQQQQLEQRLLQIYNERQRSHDPDLLVYNSKANNTTYKYNNNHHPTSNSPSPSPSFAIQFEKQWEEIDQYIRLQNEKLRFMLQEQGKQQIATLLKKMESHSLYILSQKDEEIAQAAKKRVELEDLLKRLEAENQAWKRVAQQNEAVVLSLYKTLEEMRERASYGFNKDAESCCDESRGNMEMREEGTAENGYGGTEEFGHVTRKMRLCKSCHSQISCFLFLPCRHLCSCKVCDAFLEACPVCRMPKKASIETLIF